MQARPHVGTHIAMFASALFVVASLAAAPASAVEDLDKDAPPASSPAVTDTGTLIDGSKNGTVEAEIAPERESSAPPPTSAELSKLLLGNNWKRGGYFIGVYGHYAFEVTDQIGGKDVIAPGGGAWIRLGYKHDRFWSTEISGVWTSKFKSDGSEFNGWGVFIGERFYLTKTRMQPYIGVQIGFLQLQGTKFTDKTYGFSPKFSVGVDVYTGDTLNVGFDATYYYTVGGIKDSDFTTLGLGLNWY